MDYIRGRHLKEYLDTNPSQEEKNSVAQALWDFYEYQLARRESHTCRPASRVTFSVDDEGMEK